MSRIKKNITNGSNNLRSSKTLYRERLNLRTISSFANIHNDRPRHEIITQIRGLFLAEYTIVFVSGRPDTYKKETIEWLENNIGLAEYYLLMRQGHDSRDDTDVKRDIYKNYLIGKKIIKVFDDRPRVIRMWREEGLEVVDVGSGIEF